MAVLGPDDRTDDRVAVRLLCNQGQVFADADAGDAGRNGPELAADLRGGVLLQVEHVLMGGAARQEDHDDRLVLAGGRTQSRSLLRLQQSWKGKPAHAQRSDAQEVAPRNTVAESGISRAWTEDLEHAFSEEVVSQASLPGVVPRVKGGGAGKFERQPRMGRRNRVCIGRVKGIFRPAGAGSSMRGRPTAHAVGYRLSALRA